MASAPAALKPEIAKRVGDRMRSLREARDLSLHDLTRATGMDPSNLSKVERGEYLTTVERYAVIAEALGISLATLFKAVPRRLCRPV